MRALARRRRGRPPHSSWLRRRRLRPTPPCRLPGCLSPTPAHVARPPGSTWGSISGVSGLAPSTATRRSSRRWSGRPPTRSWTRPATIWRRSCSRPSGVPKGAPRSGLLLLRGHGHVAVQRRSVLDCQPPNLDVAVEAPGAAEGEAAARRHVAIDLASNADVRAFDRGLDVGRAVHGDVAAGLELAFDVALDLEVPLDVQTAVQAVARAEIDDVVATVRGGRGCRFFSLGHLGVLHSVDELFASSAQLRRST